MKRIFTLLSISTLAITTALAQFASAPAFPGAEGYGRFTTGGRGGAVYHVTSLDDNVSNPAEGTLRYFISKKNGPRIIVFDVAGTIELKGALKIKKGDISILGQTAPGQGICLKGYNFSIDASNVIVRFIRCRLGSNGGDADAMSAAHKDDEIQKNIIIDHCSMSWSTDEVGSFYGNENFTLQWCVLSESLKTNRYKSGTHGYAGIWGGKNASFHHNLLAHNDSRMIRFDHGYVSSLTGPVDYVNNVIYNWGSNSAYGGETKEGAEAKTFNIVNNYYKPGSNTASSAKTRLINPTTACDNCTGTDVPGKFYFTGNVMEGSALVTKDNTCTAAIKMDGKSPITYQDWKSTCVSATRFTSSDAAFNYSLISQHKASDAFSKVIESAGASLSRDAVDVRITDDAKNGTGIIMEDDKSDLMIWPTLTGDKLADTDGDGMPDDFEIKYGLDPLHADANDYDLDEKKYYTNIEVYANSLVENIVKAERANAEETFEEYYPELIGTTSQIYYYVSSEKSINTIDYIDGARLSLTGNKDKSYGAASEITYNGAKYKSVKLSNGAQNTFYAPEGKTISSVKIVGCKHEGVGDRVCFWYEVNGTEYGTAELVDEKMVYTPFESTATISEIAANKLCATPNIQTFAIDGKTSFTFTNAGEQLDFILDVTYGDAEATGISDLLAAPTVARTQKARKYFENGRLVIETANGTFTVSGARIK